MRVLVAFVILICTLYRLYNEGVVFHSTFYGAACLLKRPDVIGVSYAALITGHLLGTIGEALL